MLIKLEYEELKIVEKAKEITGYSYEIDVDCIPGKQLIEIISDLIDEYGNEKEKLEDLEADVRDNYKPIPYAEQIGYNQRDFI